MVKNRCTHKIKYELDFDMKNKKKVLIYKLRHLFRNFNSTFYKFIIFLLLKQFRNNI